MVSEGNKQLQQAIAPALRVQGFKKAGPTWRKWTPDATAVLNIQGSQWGPSFYVNLGVLFRALDNRDKPCEYHCHVRTRLDSLVPDVARLLDVLDLDKPIPPEDRNRELE